MPERLIGGEIGSGFGGGSDLPGIYGLQLPCLILRYVGGEVPCCEQKVSFKDEMMYFLKCMKYYDSSNSMIDEEVT